MRNIFTVDAIQIVISDAHPEGVKSTLPGFPADFDSRNYGATEDNPDGSVDAAFRAAKSAYYARLGENYKVNPNRVLSTVTLTGVDGTQYLHESIGGFPDMTPQPQPEPEPEDEPETGDGDGE